jgi:hypothetical protein
VNTKLAAKAVLVLYGFLLSPHYYVNSNNYFSKIFFVVIISIIIATDYRVFQVIFAQGKKYRVASIVFLILMPVSLYVGTTWEYHKIMMIIILLFGYFVYKLDYPFLQRRSTDRN